MGGASACPPPANSCAAKVLPPQASLPTVPASLPVTPLLQCGSVLQQTRIKIDSECLQRRDCIGSTIELMIMAASSWLQAGAGCDSEPSVGGASAAVAVAGASTNSQGGELPRLCWPGVRTTMHAGPKFKDLWMRPVPPLQTPMSMCTCDWPVGRPCQECQEDALPRQSWNAAPWLLSLERINGTHTHQLTELTHEHSIRRCCILVPPLVRLLAAGCIGHVLGHPLFGCLPLHAWMLLLQAWGALCDNACRNHRLAASCI
jgi:hypothetical protein